MAGRASGIGAIRYDAPPQVEGPLALTLALALTLTLALTRYAHELDPRKRCMLLVNKADLRTL